MILNSLIMKHVQIKTIWSYYFLSTRMARKKSYINYLVSEVVYKQSFLFNKRQYGPTPREKNLANLAKFHTCLCFDSCILLLRITPHMQRQVKGDTVREGQCGMSRDSKGLAAIQMSINKSWLNIVTFVWRITIDLQNMHSHTYTCVYFCIVKHGNIFRKIKEEKTTHSLRSVFLLH